MCMMQSKLRATLRNKETQLEKLQELIKSAVSSNAFAKAMKLKSQIDGLSKEISSIHDTLQNLSNNNSSEEDDDINVEVQPTSDNERLILYKKSFDKALVEHDFGKFCIFFIFVWEQKQPRWIIILLRLCCFMTNIQTIYVFVCGNCFISSGTKA